MLLTDPCRSQQTRSCRASDDRSNQPDTRRPFAALAAKRATVTITDIAMDVRRYSGVRSSQNAERRGSIKEARGQHHDGPVSERAVTRCCRATVARVTGTQEWVERRRSLVQSIVPRATIHSAAWPVTDAMWSKSAS
jgi:hypothetical protein